MAFIGMALEEEAAVSTAAAVGFEVDTHPKGTETDGRTNGVLCIESRNEANLLDEITDVMEMRVVLE
jgi:hypothetical protein